MATRVSKPDPGEFDRTPYIFERVKVDERGNETTETMYSVAGRKQEFQYLYPEGRFITSLVDVRPNFVIAKCEVFLKAGDTEPFRVAFATRELDTSTEIGRRFIECAETAAIGRALANAGIGADALLDDFDQQEREAASGTPIGKKPVDGGTKDEVTPPPAEKKASKGPKPKTLEKKKSEQSAAQETPTEASEAPETSSDDKANAAVPESEVDALQVVITTTSSKTLKGKTFATALTMVKDMAKFRAFLSDLAENGTEAEKKAAGMLMVKFPEEDPQNAA